MQWRHIRGEIVPKIMAMSRLMVNRALLFLHRRAAGILERSGVWWQATATADRPYIPVRLGSSEGMQHCLNCCLQKKRVAVAGMLVIVLEAAAGGVAVVVVVVVVW